MEIKGCKFYKRKPYKAGQLVSCKLGSVMKHMCWVASEHDVLVHSESKRKWKGSTQDREKAQHRHARGPGDKGNTRNKGNIEF